MLPKQPTNPMTIPDLFELGNVYSQNQQWNNAQRVFEQALSLIYSSVTEQDAETPAGLSELLGSIDFSAVSQSPDEPWGLPQSEAPELEKLYEVLSSNLPTKDQEPNYVIVFPATLSHPHVWTVVYYNAEFKQLLSDGPAGSMKIVYPTAEVAAFVVRVSPAPIGAWRLDDPTIARMTYGWAHLAQASVLTTMAQYYVDQILNKAGIPTIRSQAAYYARSLALQPTNAWAMAHLGEVFRDVANGWPGSPEDLCDPSQKVEPYVQALFYYMLALRLYEQQGREKESFWVHAHFGAAIINVRGFVADELPQPLRGLYEYLVEVKGGEAAVESTVNLHDVLLEWAIDSLVRAQELRGYFYPWAQDYYACGLLIKSYFIQDKLLGSNIGALSMMQVITALALDPGILNNIFEPGELYVNAFFQMAIVCYALEDYSMAWQLACIGLNWAFNYNFINGLDVLSGMNLLANISNTCITKCKEDRGWKPEPSCLFKESQLSINPEYGLPTQPITEESGLCELIEQSTARYTPLVAPFLMDDSKVTTKIGMGLLESLAILECFQDILEGLKTFHPGGCSPLEDLTKRIRSKLGPVLPSISSESCTSTNFVNDVLWSLFGTGKPSYQLIMNKLGEGAPSAVSAPA